MVWAADTASSATGTGTVSHTIGGGSNRVCFVGGASKNQSSGPPTITAATYNGISCAAVAATISDPTDGWHSARLFFLLEADLPSAGAYDAVVTIGNGVPLVGAQSYSGLSQSGFDSSDSAGEDLGIGAGSLSLSPTTDGALGLDLLSVSGDRTITWGADQTELIDDYNADGSDPCSISMSHKTLAASSDSMSATPNGTPRLAYQGVAWPLAADSAAGTAAVQISPLTASAAGTQAFHGAAAASIPSLSANATGIQTFDGAAAGELQALTAAATGEQVFAGSAAATLEALTAAASGIAEAQGAAAVVLQPLLGSASGAEIFTGAAAVNLEALLAAAIGQGEVQGAADLAVQPLMASASGNFSDADVFGSATAAIQALQAEAVGGESFAGSAAAILAALTSNAVGQGEVQGTASVTIQSLIASATGVLPGIDGGAVYVLQEGMLVNLGRMMRNG